MVQSESTFYDTAETHILRMLGPKSDKNYPYLFPSISSKTLLWEYFSHHPGLQLGTGYPPAGRGGRGSIEILIPVFVGAYMQQKS